MPNQNKFNTSAFTLVELAIVILVIGLIISGITAARTLINQSQLRSVITELRNFQSSYNNFVGFYSSVPGDMRNAFSYFGTACAENASLCNGNGNGSIQTCRSSDLEGVGESRRAYVHLSLAGMLNINPPPIVSSESQNSGGTSSVIRGRTHMASKVDEAMYFLQGSLNCVGMNLMLGNGTILPWLGEPRVNTIYLARSKRNAPTGDSDSEPTAGALRASEAFEIDQKIDDGTISGGNFTGASTGNLRSVGGDPNNVSSQPCLDGSGFYNLTGTSANIPTCVIGHRLN